MDKELLLRKVAAMLGVSNSERDLAFEILMEKIAELLKPDEALKVPGLGYFQIKRKPTKLVQKIIIDDLGTEMNDTLLFSPLSRGSDSERDLMFLSFDIPSSKKDTGKLDENVFDIGFSKPILPYAQDVLLNDSDTAYLLLKKSIEERVCELLSECDKLENFDLWEDYLNSIEENIQPKSNEISLLTDLTDDENDSSENIVHEIKEVTGINENETQTNDEPDSGMEKETGSDLDELLKIMQEENQIVSTNTPTPDFETDLNEESKTNISDEIINEIKEENELIEPAEINENLKNDNENFIENNQAIIDDFEIPFLADKGKDEIEVAEEDIKQSINQNGKESEIDLQQEIITDNIEVENQNPEKNESAQSDKNEIIENKDIPDEAAPITDSDDEINSENELKDLLIDNEETEDTGALELLKELVWDEDEEITDDEKNELKKWTAEEEIIEDTESIELLKELVSDRDDDSNFRINENHDFVIHSEKETEKKSHNYVDELISKMNAEQVNKIDYSAEKKSENDKLNFFTELASPSDDFEEFNFMSEEEKILTNPEDSMSDENKNNDLEWDFEELNENEEQPEEPFEKVDDSDMFRKLEESLAESDDEENEILKEELESEESHESFADSESKTPVKEIVETSGDENSGIKLDRSSVNLSQEKHKSPTYSELREKDDKSSRLVWIIAGIIVVVVFIFVYLFSGKSTTPSSSVVEKGAVIDSNINGQSQAEESGDESVVTMKAESEKPSVPKPAEQQVKTDVKRNAESSGLLRDYPQETLISNLIFFNGSDYYLQVASYPTLEKAEAEANRLKKLGHNAFIMKAWIDKFNSYWYRVKIGYFKSVNEVKTFQKNNKF